MIETLIQKFDNFNENHIYVKREDLLPFSFGGNKVRISEEFFYDMEKKNKDALIAYGNSRSNLCRALSNMAYHKGVKCCVISPSDEDGTIIQTYNSILVNACDIKYINCSKKNVSSTILSTIKELENLGYKPYYIFGNEFGTGNESVPVNAYYKVYNQILEQEKNLNIKFDYIFVTTGTGMTHAGLICGKLLNNELHHIIGISISRTEEQEKKVLFKYIQSFLDSRNKNIDKSIIKKNIVLTDKFVGEGYGKADDKIFNTIVKMYQSEGIYLDPTYTGKSFYGMKEYLREHDIRNKNILFIHTGGAPLFFDNINNIFK